MYELGIIGVGNMGGAIIRGAIKSGLIEPQNIIIYEKTRDKVEDLISKGVTLAESEKDLVKKSKRIFLAIKPQGFKKLGESIKDDIKSDQLIISIAAGVSIDAMKKIFGVQNKYIRVMSNTPALTGEGMTAISPDFGIDKESVDFTVSLFKSVGKVVDLEEEKIAAFSGIAGCMPAYVYMFIEAAADAGVSHGIPRKDAYEMVSQALLGSAKLMLESGKHPGELKDQVTSPGGSTIKGVMALEKAGFRNAIIEAVHEGTKASEKLIWGDLMKKVLVFIADGTEEVEVITVVDYLRRADIEVDLVSVMKEKEITGAHNIKIVADKLVDEVRSSDYDGVYAPGGLPGAYHIRDNEKVISIFKELAEAGKITSALCAAPIVLDEAGLLGGKDFTCYPGFEIEINSGNHKEDITVKDGRVITGRGPAIAASLAFELIEELLGVEKRKEVEEGTLFNLLMGK